MIDEHTPLMVAGLKVQRALLDGRSRDEALAAATDWLCETFGTIERNEAYWLAIISMGASLGAAWAESAFASVTVGPALAASLACTSIPSEAMDDFRMPWRCFRCVIPAGVLGNDRCSILALRRHDERMVSITHTEWIFSFGDEPSLADFANMKMDVQGGRRFDDIGDAAGRAISLLHRIFVGVCLELETRPPGSAPPGWQSRRPRDGEPRCWEVKLTRHVHVDTRNAVRAYVEHGIKHPTVQALVRGHRKRQPCGPSGSQRKWIHIEPYWRGPEVAPIAVRSHSL